MSFIPPNKSEQALLLQDSILYNKYTHALMFLQDLIGEFSRTHEHARFTTEHIRDGINRLKTEVLKPVAQNISKNYEIAQRIRQRGESAKASHDMRAVEDEATSFLDGLVDTYTELNNMQSTQPATPQKAKSSSKASTSYSVMKKNPTRVAKPSTALSASEKKKRKS